MYVKICPDCGSTDISYREGVEPMTVQNTEFSCNRCGRIGIFPEISEEEILEFRQQLRKRA